MKKQFLILAILSIIVSKPLFGQTSPEIYIIGTTFPISEEHRTGFAKWENEEISSSELSPAMSFDIRVPEKNYGIAIRYTNFKHAPRRIIDMERSKLAELNVVDVDEFIMTHDAEQAKAWEKEHVGTVWVIDRNDFFVSPITGKEMMKVIEATIYAPFEFPSEK